MKMKELKSIISPVSEEKSHQAPSLDDKGTGDKIAGFSKFASPKKGNRSTSVDINGFAKLVNKNKHNRSANDRSKDVIAQSMIEAKQEIGVNDKSGFAKNNLLVKNTKKRSRPASASTGKSGFTDIPIKAKSLQAASLDDKGIGEKAVVLAQFASSKKCCGGASQVRKQTTEKRGYAHQPMNEAKSLQAASLDDKGIGEKAASLAQFASSKKHCGGASQVTQLTTEKCGYTDQVRLRRLVRNNAENVTTHSGQSIPANSGQRVPAQPGQRVPAQSEPHSPTQSRQRTSQSGQNTPNESLQLTAQSRQQTPEAQSGQRTSGAQSEPYEHIPTPSTVNVSSTAANDIVCWNLGSTQRDGRVRVEVINGRLEPSYDCSAKNRQIIHERLEPTGYNWKSISKATQDFYFEEFKKYFVWRQADAVIYRGWLANARRKYSEIVSTARQNWEIHNRRDNRIGLNVYLSWVEFWKTESFQAISKIQKGNRCSGVDGRPSTHTSGSASHRTVAARAKVQFKRDPTADEIFYLTHTRRVKKKKNLIGEAEENDIDDEDDEEVEIVWIDKKSQQIYETFLQLREQHEKSGKPVDRNALFLEAVGGPDKKNRVYGVGSSQSLFYQSPTTMPFTPFSATEEENQLLKDQLIKMNDRMKEVEMQLAMVIEATSLRTSLRVEHSQSLGLDDQDDNN